MAKRMKSKIQPAELKLAFQITKSGYHYIDLSQSASIINRRFYRQGLNWAVSHFTFYKTSPTTSGAEGVTVGKLPTSWIMSNAWEKSFRAWQQVIKNATDEPGSQSLKGKFLDFKIFMNSKHHANGVNDNLLPMDSAANFASQGEWDMSTIQVPTVGTGANTDWDLIALGPNNPGVGASGNNAKSLIVGYANSRALPDVVDPNVPADSSSTGDNWIMSLFTEGTQQDQEVIDTLITTGNQAPYPYEGDGANLDTMYPGGETQLPSTRICGAGYFNTGTNANKITVEGDTFPCGLVELYSSSDDNISVIVHMVPGTHRGYLAEPMTEM